MNVYSFKSVGVTKQLEKERELTKSTLPVGIKTPLQESSTDGIFAMHYNIADQVHDNLKNLLQTNWGERVILYQYGANLSSLLSDYVSQDDFDTNAIERIRNTVQQWMPYIDLNDYFSEVTKSVDKVIAIKITISYNVQTLNVKNKKLQIILKVL